MSRMTCESQTYAPPFSVRLSTPPAPAWQIFALLLHDAAGGGRRKEPVPHKLHHDLFRVFELLHRQWQPPDHLRDILAGLVQHLGAGALRTSLEEGLQPAIDCSGPQTPCRDRW